jgi:hypothetical protein
MLRVGVMIQLSKWPVMRAVPEAARKEEKWYPIPARPQGHRWRSSMGKRIW